MRTRLLALAVCTIALAARGQHPAELRTLHYDSPGGQRNTLDVLRPQQPLPDHPTVLLVHGGGWRGGTRQQLDELRDRLAARGFWVVNADYTLCTAQRPSWPQALLDLKAVVRWIRTDGRALGLPPTLVVLGLSSGAQLAALLGTTAGVAPFEPLPAPPGGYRPDLVVTVSAVADFVLHVRDLGDRQGGPGQPGSPVAEFLGRTYVAGAAPEYAAASPVSWIDGDDPPFLILHGTADVVVEYAQAQRLDAALDDAGVPSLLLPAEGAGHGFSGWGGPDGVARLVALYAPALVGGPRTLIVGVGRSGDGARVPVLLATGTDRRRLLVEDAPPLATGLLCASLAPAPPSFRGGAPWPGLVASLVPFATASDGSFALTLPHLPGRSPELTVQALLLDDSLRRRAGETNALRLAPD